MNLRPSYLIYLLCLSLGNLSLVHCSQPMAQQQARLLWSSSTIEQEALVPQLDPTTPTPLYSIARKVTPATLLLLITTLFTTWPEPTVSLKCFPEIRVTPKEDFGVRANVWIEDNHYVNASLFIYNVDDYYTKADLERPVEFHIAVGLTNSHYHPFVWAFSPLYTMGCTSSDQTCHKPKLLTSFGFQLPKTMDIKRFTTIRLYADKYAERKEPEPHIPHKLQIKTVQEGPLQGYIPSADSVVPYKPARHPLCPHSGKQEKVKGKKFRKGKKKQLL